MQAKKRKRRSTRDRFTEKAYQSHVMAIGQLALAWNALHESLASIFHLLLDRQLEEHETIDPMPIALWLSVKFDRPKRQLLKALIETEQKEFKEAFPSFESDLLWILQEVDSLEDARNTAIHSPLVYFEWLVDTNNPSKGTILPNLIYGNERAFKLARKDMLTEFRWCRDTALVFRDFVELINTCLSFGVELNPWPDRPSLPNRGQKTKPRRVKLQ